MLTVWGNTNGVTSTFWFCGAFLCSIGWSIGCLKIYLV